MIGLICRPTRPSILFSSTHPSQDVGTHAQLMQRSEVYQTLVRRQIMQGDEAEAEGESMAEAAAPAAAPAANGASSPHGGRTVQALS